MEKNIEKYLVETKFCDFSHPEIKKISKKIIGECNDKREKAVKLFYWVRDNILYELGNWNRKASETLKKRRGGCSSKANLLVALFRLNNIPAGYGLMRVYTRRYFGPLAIPLLTQFSSEISYHIYCGVYLENKWIKCDPSDDKELSENTSYINPQSKLVEWDGVHDAMLNLDKNDILEDNFPITNIDFLLSKKPRHAKGIPLKIANLYIKFFRENKEKFNDVKEAEFSFQKWLKKHYLPYFYLFFIYQKISKIINKRLIL